MSTTELTAQIESLRALEELIEEAKAEAETLRDEIKTSTSSAGHRCSVSDLIPQP